MRELILWLLLWLFLRVSFVLPKIHKKRKREKNKRQEEDEDSLAFFCQNIYTTVVSAGCVNRTWDTGHIPFSFHCVLALSSSRPLALNGIIVRASITCNYIICRANIANRTLCQCFLFHHATPHRHRYAGFTPTALSC